MRAARSIAVALLSCLAFAGASAQTPTTAAQPPVLTGVQILPASRLGTMADSIPTGPVTTRQIARFDGLANSMTRRDTSGMHERHERFTDIFIVQRGRATLRYGGTAEGERQTRPGEWMGGTIRNGSESPLGPGDVVVIPAGVPHQLLLAPGDSFVYFVFKVEKKP